MTDTSRRQPVPLVESDDLKVIGTVSRERLNADVEKIAEYVRLSGTADEFASFDYIETQLHEMGLEVARYSCNTLISLPVSASMQVLSPTPTDINCITHSMAISTPSDGYESDLVYVGAGKEPDFAGIDVAGKIAMMDGMSSPACVARAEARGCFAQIFVNDDHLHAGIVSRLYGSPSADTLDQLPRSVTISITDSDGRQLKQFLMSSPVSLRIHAEVDTGWREIPLLTVDVQPENNDGTYVFFGAHVDSWDFGAIDNGAGNAALLEIARCTIAARGQIKRGVRFLFWSGHSHGRYAGSCWYVDHHWQDLYDHAIAAMAIDSPGGRGANVDSLGGAKVMDELVAVAMAATERVAGKSGGTPKRPTGGEQPLWRVGVPSLNPARLRQTKGSESSLRFEPEASWWHHTTEDTIDKLDLDVLVKDTQIYLSALWNVIRPDVLPFDYEKLAGAIVEHLRALPNSVDFTAAISGADSLAAAARRIPNLSPPHANRVLKTIGRKLIPVLYTEQGQFEPDAIDGTGFLPGLRIAHQLPEMSRTSTQANAIRTQLVRERNRLVFALRESVDAILGAEHANA